MRIAVLVNRYPAVTHSFIRREILGLERAGIEVLRVSIARSPDPLVEPADRAEAGRTLVLLERGAFSLLAAFAGVAAARPRGFLRALRLALAFARRGDRSPLRHLAYLVEACWLLRWCKAERVSHVHAHFGTNACAVAALLRALGGPPYSFVAHGPEEFERAAGLALERKRADAAFVVAPSEHCREALERITPAAAGVPIHLIRCGVEPPFLEAPETELPSAPRIVCVGQLLPRKGQALLLAAVAELVREGSDVELTLVGDGPLRGALEAQSRALGLRDRVHFRGWAAEDGVRKEIISARALVAPSLAEGLPVVLMEALALGRPVLCTQIAGHGELVEDGESGWLIPPGSPDALAKALRELLALPPARLAAMGRRGRARVAELHDAQREAEKLAELLRASSAAP
jgi:glycosyltransferase involved in cell wall biosynthesis